MVYISHDVVVVFLVWFLFCVIGLDEDIPYIDHVEAQKIYNVGCNFNLQA